MDKKLAFCSRFEKLNNSFIDRVLVLLKPASYIVVHNTSIVRYSKVSILVSFGCRLQEDWQFSKRCFQLFLKTFISGFWKERFFLENCPNSHRFLKHDDSSCQIHTKVHHDPINSFFNIFFLFNHKHVVIKELLEFFIDKVDGNLFKAIVLKDLKASNVKHSTEVCFLEGGINQSVITFLNEPLEDTIKDSTSNTSSSTSGLLNVLTLGHPLCADLDS